MKRLLRLKQVIDRVGFKKSKIYDLMKKGDFPAGIKIDSCRLWYEEEIDQWVETLKKDTDGIQTS